MKNKRVENIVFTVSINICLIIVLISCSKPYNLSLYEGDCCVKSTKQWTHGYDIDFGKFKLNNNIKKTYTIRKLPPNERYHFVELVFYDISDEIKILLDKSSVKLRAWSKENVYFNINEQLSDFSSRRDHTNENNYFYYYVKSYYDNKNHHNSFFTQEMLKGDALNLSLEFINLSQSLVKKEIDVSLLVSVKSSK